MFAESVCICNVREIVRFRPLHISWTNGNGATVFGPYRPCRSAKMEFSPSSGRVSVNAALLYVVLYEIEYMYGRGDVAGIC